MSTQHESTGYKEPAPPELRLKLNGTWEDELSSQHLDERRKREKLRQGYDLDSSTHPALRYNTNADDPAAS